MLLKERILSTPIKTYDSQKGLSYRIFLLNKFVWIFRLTAKRDQNPVMYELKILLRYDMLLHLSN